MKNLILFVGLNFLLINSSIAGHIFGSNLTYECLGSNQYLLKLKIVRDCMGISVNSVYPFNVNNICGGIPFTDTLRLDTMYELTNNCTNTTCNGGVRPGFQVYEFSAVLTFPDTCSYWTIGVQLASRSQFNAFLNWYTANYSTYVEVDINNTIPCTNSPSFYEPTPFQCMNQQNCVTPGYTTTSDSTVWAFATPMDGPNQPIPYATGYSVQFPMDLSSPLSMNQVTSEYCFNTNTIFTTAIAVLAFTYVNGVFASRVVQDMGLYTFECMAGPQISGINNGLSVDTVACPNEMLCFDVYTDPYLSYDSSFIGWNQGILANFTVHPGINEYASICWTPQVSDTGTTKCFTINATENDCMAPRNAQQTFCITTLDSAACAILLDAKKLSDNSPTIDIFFQNNSDIDIKIRGPYSCLTIYDLAGKQILKYSFENSNHIFITSEDLSPGVYIAELTNSNGEPITKRKFVKPH